MADPILGVDNVYSPGPMLTPEQLPNLAPPSNPVPELDLSKYASGSGGGQEGLSPFSRQLAAAVANIPMERDRTAALTPIEFNRKESGFDPIYNSFADGLYRKIGFVPGRDNEDIYARELGKSGQLWQGLKGILPLAGIAHNEAWRSEADMWGGLFTGDLKKAFSLTMDEEDLKRLSASSENVFNTNFVPLTEEQRNSSLNMGKFARGLQQFGFTLGTTAQFLEQSALEWGAAALTAPGTVGGSIVAEIANMTRRAAKAASTINKLYDVNQAFKNIVKFENTLMDTNRIAKAFNYMNDVRKASPIGSFGNFYRFTKEYNFAAAEARFERAQSYTDHIESKEREYFLQNGRPMDDDTRAKVEEEAMQISNANGVTNIALLYAMNRLNMGNVLRTGFGLSKAIAAETGTIAGDIIQRSTKPFSIGKYFGKKGAAQAEKAVAKAADGPFMKASDVKMFSSEWFRGKGSGTFRWGVDSAWEGMQEVGQSISSEYWKNYYNEKFALAEEARNDWGTLMGVGARAIKKAGAAQNSMEGLDTFLSGFIIGVPSVAMNRGIGAAQRRIFSKEYAEKEQRLQNTVNALNNWAKSPMQVFNRNLEGYVNQTEIAAGMQKAVNEKNIYAFKNLERKAFQEFVMTSYKAGKLDAMLDIMDQAANDLTDEQFKETFGIESDSVSRKTAKDYVAGLREKAQGFVKTYDDAVRRMPNPVNYKQYKEGTPERTQAEMEYKAWDKALEDYVFQRDANVDLVNRYKDILNRNQENLGAQAYSSFYKMTNKEFVELELQTLEQEIASMEAQGVNLTQDQREILKEKKKEKDLLTKWNAEMGTLVKPGEISAPATPSKVFTDYLNLTQRKNNLPDLEAEKVRDAFNDLSDLYRLSEDQKRVVANLNYLASPENFSKQYFQHLTMMSDVYKDIMKMRDETKAKREQIIALVEGDEAFRQKHFKLIEELDSAIAENNAELVAEILDKLYQAEFGEPITGKDDNDPDDQDPPATGGATVVADDKKTKRQGFNGIDEVTFKDPTITLEGFKIDGNYYNVITNMNRAKVLVNIRGVIVPFYLTTGQGGKNLTPGWYPFFGIGNDGWLNKTDKSDMETYYERYWGAEVAGIIKGISGELNAFYGTDPATFKNDADPTTTDKPLSALADKAENYVNSKLSIKPAVNDANARTILRANAEQLGREILAKFQTNKDSVYDNIVASINAATLPDIATIAKQVGEAEDKGDITLDELEALLDLLEAKREELLEADSKPPTTFLSETDPEFVEPYNEVLANIEKVIAKPDVSVADVDAAFAALRPIVARLDKDTRKKYYAELAQKKQQIVDTIKKNLAAQDIKGTKQAMTDLLNNMNLPLLQSVEDLFNLVNLQLDPSLKDEAVDHFKSEFEKSVDKRVAKLLSMVNTGATGPVLEKLNALAQKYRSDLERSLELFSKKSEELAAAKGDLSFTTEVTDNYVNTTHTSILKYRNGSRTAGQKQAIDNLVRSGVISDLDLEVMDPNSKHGASEIINMGVSRIYALQINKAVDTFAKDQKKTGDLKTILKEYYISTGVSPKEAAVEVEGFIDDFTKGGINTVDEILEVLGINKTPEISDEQYKTLNAYRNAVSAVIKDGNLLGILDNLAASQQMLLSQQLNNDTDLILSDDLLGVFKSMLVRNSDNKTDYDGFKQEFIKLYEKLKSETDPLAALKQISAFSTKHFGTYYQMDGKSLVHAYLSYAMQTDLLLASGDTDTAQLAEEEMVDILSNPVRSLSKEQISQVEDFAKTALLDKLTKKFQAANGYTPQQPVLGIQKNVVSIPIGKLSFISLRPKDASDLRTGEELERLFQVDSATKKFSVKTALQAIIDSEFATDAEKIMAGQLLNAVGEDEMITVDNQLSSYGEFDSESGEMSINLSALGYKPNEPSAAVETVILHELIHSKIENAIADPNSEYGKAIRAVFNAVKGKPGASSFYAFSKDLTEDEQIREFVTEAMTNPAFQYMLSKVPYANSKKSTWEKFMEIIKNLLSAIGVNVEETALGEVLSLTSELITPNSSNQNISEDNLYPQEKLLDKLRSIESLEDVTKIMQELAENVGVFTESVYNSVLSAIKSKELSIRALQSRNVLKDATRVKVNNNTLYYKLSNGKLEVYRKMRGVAKRVRKTETLNALIDQLIKDKKNIVGMMSKADVELIRQLAGDPRKQGTYASGTLSDELISETRFPNASQVRVGFRFKDNKEYQDFVNKFWKWKAGRYDKQRLIDEYGKTSFMNYVELTERLERKDIAMLVKKGIIQPVGKGVFLEEIRTDADNPVTDDELFDMYEFILSGGKLDSTEYQDTRKAINDTLSRFLGFKVSDELQNKLEDTILYGSQEVPDTPDVEGDEEDTDTPELVIFTDKADEDYIEDFKTLQFFDVPTYKDKSAKNEVALRSHSFDVFYDDKTQDYKETDDFANYYHKIRNIINKLSLAPIESFQDVRITIDKENSLLRWDGSARSEGYQKANKGAIGYLSDANGNPIVFDKEGNRIDVLDRNNLSDDKGLNNGENQIVYFTLPASNKNGKYEEESFARLQTAKNAALQGVPQIAKIAQFNKGVMNVKDQATPSTVKSKNTAKNPEFRDAIMRPTNHLEISGTGYLNVVIQGPDGSINRRGLFPSNSRNISISTKTTPPMGLVDYVFEAMKTYLENSLDNKPGIGDIKSDLVTFAYNIWLTGDRYKLKIPQSFETVSIKVLDKNAMDQMKAAGIPITNENRPYIWERYQIFNVNYQDKTVTVNQENLRIVRNFINGQPVNAYRKWLSGEEAFKFPVIVDQNGEKSLKFVEKDYQQFLVDEVGLKAYFMEIPDQQDIKRYNSGIQFTLPSDLLPVTPTQSVDQEDIIDNADAIKDKVAEGIKNAAPATTAKSITKRVFKAPKFDPIYEKTCN